MSKLIKIRDRVYENLTKVKNGSYSDTIETMLNKTDSKPNGIPSKTNSIPDSIPMKNILEKLDKIESKFEDLYTQIEAIKESSQRTY